MTAAFGPITVAVLKGNGIARTVYIVNRRENLVAHFELNVGETYCAPANWEEFESVAKGENPIHSTTLCTLDGFIPVSTKLQR